MEDMCGFTGGVNTEGDVTGLDDDLGCPLIGPSGLDRKKGGGLLPCIGNVGNILGNGLPMGGDPRRLGNDPGNVCVCRSSREDAR